MEPQQWQEAENLGATPSGAVQPFYHVLIDSRDRRHPSSLPPVAYIAQDCLSAPEVGLQSACLGSVSTPVTSVEQMYGQGGYRAVHSARHTCQHRCCAAVHMVAEPAAGRLPPSQRCRRSSPIWYAWRLGSWAHEDAAAHLSFLGPLPDLSWAEHAG